MITEHKRQALKRFTEADNTYATVLVAIFIDLFGIEALNWEPTSIRLAFEDVGIPITQKNIEKLQAGIAIITSDAFYKDPFSFNLIADALDGDVTDPSVFDPVDPYEAAWAVIEAQMLYDDADVKWSDDVKAFIGVILSDVGVVSTPAPLTMATIPATPYIDEDQSIQRQSLSRSSEIEDEFRILIGQNIIELLKQLNELPIDKSDDWDIVRDKIRAAFSHQLPYS